MASEPYSAHALGELRRILLAPEFLADAISPVLVDLLRDQSAQLASEMMEALAPALRLAIREALRDELRDPSPEVVAGLTDALEPAITQVLRQQLSHPGRRARQRSREELSGDRPEVGADAATERSPFEEAEATPEEATSAEEARSPDSKAPRRGCRRFLAFGASLLMALFSVLWCWNKVDALVTLILEHEAPYSIGVGAGGNTQQIALASWHDLLDNQPDGRAQQPESRAQSVSYNLGWSATTSALPETALRWPSPTTEMRYASPTAPFRSAVPAPSAISGATARVVSFAPPAPATPSYASNAVTMTPIHTATDSPTARVIEATRAVGEPTLPTGATIDSPTKVIPTTSPTGEATEAALLPQEALASDEVAEPVIAELTVDPVDPVVEAPIVVTATLELAISDTQEVPLRPQIARIESSDRALYLTFDDGPNGLWTPQILDILAQYDARATFFVIGQEAAKRPRTVRAIVDAGHVVCHHTWSHRILEGLDRETFMDEINATSQALGDAISPCLRPPQGTIDADARSFADELGLEIIRWSIDPEDWRLPPAEDISSAVIDEARSGKIVVLHDGGGDRSQTVAALPVILATLREQGYVFKTILER